MRKLLVLLLTAVLGLAACGSDDKTENASDSDAVTTTEAKDSSSGGSSDAYCGLESKYSGLENSLTPGGDTASLRTSVEAAKDALDEAVDAAPGEIKADVQVFVDAYGPFLDALAKANYDFTKLNPQDPAFAQIQKPEVATAAENIAAWSKAHCGTG